MSKQLKTPSLTGSPVSIWFDADWNEYQVRIAGKLKATYHTDCKRDALQTAQVMRNKFCPPVENPPGETLAVPTVAELVDTQIMLSALVTEPGSCHV